MLPERKNIRLKGYDYSKQGCYFITLCTLSKAHIFGYIEIVGDAALGVPKMFLNHTGKAVEQYIKNINQQNSVILENYIVMPNHVHLLISLSNTSNGTPKAASPTKSMIPKLVNALKGLSSKKIGRPLWQRSYYDHIVRDEHEFQLIWQYIDENPLSWTLDKYYSV